MLPQSNQNGFKSEFNLTFEIFQTLLDVREQKASRLPHFVSKFDGRTNGGIPCFSEERCLERIAAKVSQKNPFGLVI